MTTLNAPKTRESPEASAADTRNPSDASSLLERLSRWLERDHLPRESEIGALYRAKLDGRNRVVSVAA